MSSRIRIQVWRAAEGYLWRARKGEVIVSGSKSASTVVRLAQGAACVMVAGLPVVGVAQTPQPIDRVQEIRAALLRAEPAAPGGTVDADEWDNFSNWNKV
jgi:hypothetical protein